MLRLAIDTATPELSLALGRDGEVEATHDPGPLPGGGRRVLESVHQLLDGAGVAADQLDRIVVGVGPGGFTGIRIGIATALGLGHACGSEVRGVSSLAALAQGIARDHSDAPTIAAAIDARRGEVFAALYRRTDGCVAELTAPAALRPADLVSLVQERDPDGELRISGSGVEAYRDQLEPCGARLIAPTDGRIGPSATDLLLLDAADQVLPARPVYCRLPDAEEARRRAAGADS